VNPKGYDLHQLYLLHPNFAWLALRDAYRARPHTALTINMGGPSEEPLTMRYALNWANRIAQDSLEETP